MPIYAYKCESCGHAKDVLQKMSDAPLVDCSACGAPDFKKQLTAAGFQLKGSGWYVTDFRDGKGGGDKAKESGSADKSDVSVATATGAAATPAKAETATPISAPSAAVASPAPAPKASA
ncbi:MAG: zinc ribbon domain-containing protein [Polaromonas sp.]|nr:zinc ribbon domain-containing protein [Polaromonas sp.]